jgi:hypothetical protein
MAKLNDERAERLRTKTVELLLEVRRAYLAIGANPIKHWDQIQSRMLSAARRSTTVDEWVSSLCRGLGLPALNSLASSAVVSLSAEVREADVSREWLDLMQREYGLLMAMTRLAADEARRAAEERKRNDGEK